MKKGEAQMQLKHSLPKEAVECIDFYASGNNGEAGWVIYLNDGWSFDPGSNDSSRFVSADNPGEVDSFVVYQLEVA
jgi:hypothetical protein